MFDYENDVRVKELFSIGKILLNNGSSKLQEVPSLVDYFPKEENRNSLRILDDVTEYCYKRGIDIDALDDNELRFFKRMLCSKVVREAFKDGAALDYDELYIVYDAAQLEADRKRNLWIQS